MIETYIARVMRGNAIDEHREVTRASFATKAEAGAWARSACETLGEYHYWAFVK